MHIEKLQEIRDMFWKTSAGDNFLLYDLQNDENNDLENIEL